MCGICGFLHVGRPVSDEDAAIVKRMNGTLIHRGPDSQETLLVDTLALGFSRLSIIALDNGMQPIWNEDESIVLICNGEIFNYIELREQLLRNGHRFRTGSDVEVIVHLYEEQGTDFLNELNGQFAFALYDRKKRQLFCARDQVGIIPFYYSVAGGSFVFGSEIKALLEYPLVNREVDLVGLDQIFTFAGLISPRTMFKGIHSLENGHLLTIDHQGTIVNREYWDLQYPDETAETENEDEEYFINGLEKRLDASIRLRLRSDVPLGFYLSGGLDSSMITMRTGQLEKGIRKEAFSIDFIDSQLSESMFQRIVAESSNTLLHRKIFFYDDISRRLKKSIYHSECPIKETYNTASLSLSEAVREKGIKVILSGEGADELFAGYVGYRFDKMRSMNLIRNPSSPEEEALRERIWGDKDFFYERNFLAFDAIKRRLYAPELAGRFGEFNCLNHHIVDKSRLAQRSVLHKRAYVDFKLRLVDHLVSDHGDRMALANSVEVRYPFLDKGLVEFSTRVPSRLKLMDFTEKYILKKMAARFVPQSIVEREKFGFVAPGSPYLLQKKNEYIEHLLSDDVIRRQGYFNPAEIARLRAQYSKDGFSINAPFEDDLLITVITFGMLLDHFFTY